MSGLRGKIAAPKHGHAWGGVVVVSRRISQGPRCTANPYSRPHRLRSSARPPLSNTHEFALRGIPMPTNTVSPQLTDARAPRPGMEWIPAGEYTMGSDRHYR